MANPKTIKIRYGKDETPIEETPTEPPKTKSKRKMTDAQKEALEKARLVLLEKKKREKEDRERLKQQEKEIDKVIMERASKGIELRMKMEQLKKDLELLQEEEKKELGALREPLGNSVASTQSASGGLLFQDDVSTKQTTETHPPPPPDTTPTEDSTPLQDDEIKIVSRIQGKKKKGRKVILIDASVFENSSDEEQQPKIHKIKKQMREPRRRADRRTRFERDPDLVYSDEEDDDYEPIRPPQQRRQEQPYIMSDNVNENIRHFAPAPIPPNPHQQIVSHEQMRYENPLYSRIFG